MTLTLGQRGCLSSTDILPDAGPFSKGFVTLDCVNSLTFVVVDGDGGHRDGLIGEIAAVTGRRHDLRPARRPVARRVADPAAARPARGGRGLSQAENRGEKVGAAPEGAAPLLSR